MLDSHKRTEVSCETGICLYLRLIVQVKVVLKLIVVVTSQNSKNVCHINDLFT